MESTDMTPIYVFIYIDDMRVDNNSNYCADIFCMRKNVFISHAALKNRNK